MKSTNNAFSIGFCTLTGKQRTPPKLPNANQFTKPTTAFAKSGISIPKLADYDNRRGMRRASI